MDPEHLRGLLEGVRAGEVTPADALARLRELPFAAVEEVAKVDHHRALRCGVPEVIFCSGKRPEDVARIAQTIAANGGDLLATRADAACAAAVKAVLPAAQVHERARAIVLRRPDAPPPAGLVLVVSAGTSDIPVAEEARVTAETFGSRVRTIFDVGVAGLHRILHHRAALEEANAVVVVAGMDGALPSVVGGLTSRPVIAVPTSVGYGASFGGLAALLTMLNACSAGISVVNIDNGFGAGTIAHRINRAVVDARAARPAEPPQPRGALS
ncbi:MAG TPA: nickel pincer cofactor biosynthesis protein LarB [Planctomycetota bacterium]|nr:nickel pincer cofactor biosynthesis protein LarB [Planctomycetota bacterium]